MESKTAPIAQEVVRRTKILYWVVGFAFNMPPPNRWPEARARLSPQQLGAFLAQVSGCRDRLLTQLRSSWHWAAMTDAERQLAQTLSCEVSEQQWLDAIWCLEAVGVLLWALQRIDSIPPFDTPFKNPSLLLIVEKGLDAAELRSAGEIQRMRDIAQSWHWRSRTRELQESGEKPPAEMGFPDFDSIVRSVVSKYETDGTIPRAIAEDFPAKGKAYRDLTQVEFCEVRSVAMERHHALNWLCGYGRDNRWDETPTST